MRVRMWQLLSEAHGGRRARFCRHLAVTPTPTRELPLEPPSLVACLTIDVQTQLAMHLQAKRAYFTRARESTLPKAKHM